ncbi:MAG: DNA repair protein RecO [Desulfobacteraceae bacterium]|nr:MAG: DNA repair protein RecO [Desulfobacteraceae bacterium]
MTHYTSPAIVLRRREYGDFDLILTVLTPDNGLCTLIAKAAKKSKKRFPGILELFAGLQIVYHQGRGKGMPVLEEATLEDAYSVVRSDIMKTAYASYWVELVVLWLEAGQARPDVYALLSFVLDGLSRGAASGPLLNLLFQMRFIGQEGLRPVLERCACCQKAVEQLAQQQFCIDLTQGGIICHACASPVANHLRLGKGTLKQLLWMADGPASKALRVRFTAWAMAEATEFLEAFVPYHIGRMPKSLGFLRQVRSRAPA